MRKAYWPIGGQEITTLKGFTFARIKFGGNLISQQNRLRIPRKI